MINSLFSESSYTLSENVVTLTRNEFEETLSTVESLLEFSTNPEDLIIEDPFLSEHPIKVDLGQHLKNLHSKLRRISNSLDSTDNSVIVRF